MVGASVGIAAPGYFTRFVGRSSERVAITELLAASDSGPVSRLLTLVGPGGIGKTRLAAEVAGSLVPTSAVGTSGPDGCGWVDVGVLSDAGELPAAAAAAVGLPYAGGTDPVSTVARVLRPRRQILVLDGCERLIRASATLAQNLLDRCPHLTVLATSPVALGPARERVMRIPPLEIDGRQLFLDRAAAAATCTGGSSTTQSLDQEAVDALCRRVGDSPLAIELLAGWVDEWDSRDLLEALVIGRRGAAGEESVPPIAVLEVLCSRLDERERRALRGLGAFASDIPLEAAMDVAEADLASLAGLTRRGVIDRVPRPEEATVFRLHPIVRVGARRMLSRHPAAPAVRDRHLRYQVRHAEREGTGEGGPRLIAAATQAEYRVALAAGQASRDQDAVLRLLAAVHRSGARWQPTRQFREIVEAAVAAPAGPAIRVTAAGAGTLEAAGRVAAECGDHEVASLRFAAAAAAYALLGAFPEQAVGLRGAGRSHLALGQVPAAREQFDESLRICRRVSDVGGAGWSLLHLADIAAARGRPAEEAELLQQAVEHFGRADVIDGLCRAWIGIGRRQAAADRYTDAVEAYGHALTQARRRSPAVQASDVLVGLADLSLRLREPRHAASLVGAAQAWGDVVGQSDDTAARCQDVAVRLWGDDAPVRTESATELARDDALEAADLAVHALTQVCRRRSAGLTAREVEVLRLVAEGLTTGSIASRLAVSPRTVHAHLRSSYGKLGVGSRTAAVRAAERGGLW